MDFNQEKDTAAPSFSFITIGEEEVDEVIQAGVVERPEPVVEEPQESVDSFQPEELTQPEEPVVKAVSDKAPKKAQAYRETTLEDLDAAPMPLVQKVVLVLAAVLIVAAIAYFVI